MMNLIDIIPELVFYLFATVAIVCALVVALGRKPVVSIIALVMVFIATAILWLLANAEFLALALIFVYVGAVMTLFLFVVMMLNVNDLPVVKNRSYLFLGWTVLVSFIVMLAWITNYVVDELASSSHIISPEHADKLTTQAIGHVLYTKWWPGFELVAVLLLVAMVAAIGIVYRSTKVRKVQVISEQKAVSKATRLTLIEDSK